ncbi:MAG: sigma-70 family RNA polymerase sigma factor [Eubacterium sp.]|nr:sigma-70 family RNA polymerase sigma factor [Eubacterium sp.]MDE6156063.1 sigma-70 family RNA polymerase sigma factor [Eubacterium sp.]MDE6766701.1 sigma-70 family RNA polymerase sigma factor [Eubacterium sp.]
MSEFNVKTYDEILSNAQSGDNAYLEAVIVKYRQIVEFIASKYKESPMEREDLIQEGMIGLLAAIKSYDSKKGASFNTYSKICIDNSIQTALRKFNRQKDIPLQNVVEYQEEEMPIENGFDSAEDIVIAQESVSLLTKVLRENLSDFENEVLRLHIVGCSYNEIAKRLCKSPKAIDNALQRVRKKLIGISL